MRSVGMEESRRLTTAVYHFRSVRSPRALRREMQWHWKWHSSQMINEIAFRMRTHLCRRPSDPITERLIIAPPFGLRVVQHEQVRSHGMHRLHCIDLKWNRRGAGAAGTHSWSCSWLWSSEGTYIIIRAQSVSEREVSVAAHENDVAINISQLKFNGHLRW